MEVEQYTKRFYNEETDAVYNTLKAAKGSSKHPCVYRCWMQGDEIIAMTWLLSYGTPIRTIKSADEKISLAIKNGTVGKGFKDKRYVD